MIRRQGKLSVTRHVYSHIIQTPSLKKSYVPSFSDDFGSKSVPKPETAAPTGNLKHFVVLLSTSAP